MMNTKQSIVWKLIAQMVLLLVLYAAASLMTVVKFLANDPMLVALPYQQISGIAHIMLDLALLSGLIAVALHYALENASDLLNWAFRGWTLLLVLSFLTGLLGWLEGRHMLEMPFLLDILLVALLILWLVIIWQGSQQSEAKTVFLLGFVFIIVAFTLSFFPASNPAQDRVLRIIMVNARFFLGYGLSAIAVIAWLKREESSAFFNAGILLIVGTLMSLNPLNAIWVINFPSIITFPVILLGMLILAQRMVVQGQLWFRAGLALLISSMGLLAAILAIPSVGQLALGTHFANLTLDLLAWTVILILLATVSQWLEGTLIARGLTTTNKLIIGAVIASNLVLLLIGVVQVYMERIMSMGYLDSQAALIPIYTLWIVSHLLWGIGLVVYANRYLGSGNHLMEVGA